MDSDLFRIEHWSICLCLVVCTVEWYSFISLFNSLTLQITDSVLLAMNTKSYCVFFTDVR